MIDIKLFDFQQDTINYLLNRTTEKNSKHTIVVKAPTGAGKTVMLIGYIDEYLKLRPNTAFVWLCPGKGDLEIQSKEKMDKFCRNRNTNTLFDSLSQGFEAQSTTFINWELVTKKGNTAIKDSEKKNLFDRIEEARRNGIEFILIIDEEHSNDTKKAQDIIYSFHSVHTIRVSATTTHNSSFDFYEIPEEDVINSGLITKAISVNEGVDNNTVAEDESLLLLADEKRKAIASAYKSIGANIRPLVLVQFPNGEEARIKEVEKQLNSMGYTRENKLLAVWMADDKALPDNIVENNGEPVFLLMKQAITTGWDCPRAKILVKLREGGNEKFQIQTVGRIRRMPEQKHYDVQELDYCYVYTFDKDYQEGLLASIDKSYQSQRLFLKDKCISFNMVKENRDLDYEGLSPKKLLKKVAQFLNDKYHLTNDINGNKLKLNSAGYVFGTKLNRTAVVGIFRNMESLTHIEANRQIGVQTEVNTHAHGIYYLHVFEELRKIMGVSTENVRSILKRLFHEKVIQKNKFLKLSNTEFYAFIINNEGLLKEEFREISAEQVTFLDMKEPVTSTFQIPEQDFFKYDTNDKLKRVYESNSYNNYTSGHATTLVRSTPEMLFEKYCDKNNNIDWVYKNGDTGKQYLSIVYYTGAGKQRLFYPDYIVKTVTGDTWLIETKGGEVKGQDKNIDMLAAIKFRYLKEYAEKYNVKWAFVRDKDGELYYSNTEYTDDLGDCWNSIEHIL